MAADVVHGYERHSQAVGQALGEVHAHEQRADKPRRICNGHGVYVRAGEAGDRERAVGELVDHLDVAAGGYFRHDAAVHGVQVGLGKHLVG